MNRAAAIGGFWLLVWSVTGAEPLRIATFNIENYGPANRMTAAGYRKDYPKPETAKRALREVIRGLEADVLVLQEMGGRPYLEELRRDLAGEGVRYPHAELLEAADEVRHVAVLAKRPFKAVTRHTDLTFKYFDLPTHVKRGLLEVVLPVAGGEVTLWALHLKSRYTDRPDDPASARRRAGEATAIRDRVLERFPRPAEARFVIAGDFNDGKSSAPLRYIQKRGRTTIATLLPARDSRGETWTYVFRRDEIYNRVDHILVSPGLRSAVPVAGAEIYDGPGVLEASDHRPVVVTLDVK